MQNPETVAHEKYHISVEEVKTFHEDGFLIVRNLVSQAEVQELIGHTVDVMHGRVVVPGRIEPPPPNATIEEIEGRYVRIHQLHFHLEIHERYLLNPRILMPFRNLVRRARQQR